MKKTLAAAVALACLPAIASVETYTIDSRHTFPAYEIGHMGMSFQRGRFNKTSGKVSIDKAARTGSVEVTIDAASVSSGVDKLDEHLRGEDFFNVAKNPQIVFKAANLALDGDKVKSAPGELTMNGVSKPVVLTAESFSCGTHPVNKKAMCGGEFTARIKRSDWNMKYGAPSLADDVLLRINVEAFRD